MRIQVIAGRQKLLVPIDSGDRTIAWLATEIGRRLGRLKRDLTEEPVYNKDKAGPSQHHSIQKAANNNKYGNLHNSSSNSDSNVGKPNSSLSGGIRGTGSPVPIRELRTSSNHRLDMDDQIYDVLHSNDIVVAITGSALSGSDQDEVKPGDMINQYYLIEQIGEGTFGMKKIFLDRLLVQTHARICSLR
jgi:hypothetical protein